MGNLQNKTALTVEEKRLLAAAIVELRSRGKTPSVEAVKPKSDWNRSDAGYYKRIDGRQYKPVKAHQDFIESEARFVALISGRGGGEDRGWITKGNSQNHAGQRRDGSQSRL